MCLAADDAEDDDDSPRQGEGEAGDERNANMIYRLIAPKAIELDKQQWPLLLLKGRPMDTQHH